MFTVSKLCLIILATLYLSLPWITRVCNSLPTTNTNEQNVLYRFLPHHIGVERVFIPDEVLPSSQNDAYTSSMYLPKRSAYMDLPWGKRAFQKRAAYIDLPWG
ncbi:unnamed protein product [Heterobilharzia americana]|nr:unnamed protein product [Heterobilharzia americana]